MNTTFENIKQGLQEAIAHARGDVRGACVGRSEPENPDIKAEQNPVPVGVRCASPPACETTPSPPEPSP
jgi:hypothetical protein